MTKALMSLDRIIYSTRLSRMLCASTIVIKAAILLTVSNRWDGDSRLSKGNKWASFPSVAAAWRISDEAFLKNVEALSNLKLRLSWGKTGNSGIMAYGTQSGLTPKPTLLPG